MNQWLPTFGRKAQFPLSCFRWSGLIFKIEEHYLVLLKCTAPPFFQYLQNQSLASSMKCKTNFNRTNSPGRVAAREATTPYPPPPRFWSQIKYAQNRLPESLLVALGFMHGINTRASNFV